MFKIMKNQAPEYLNNLIPKRKRNFNSRTLYIPSYNRVVVSCRAEYFKSSFFPASFEECFYLDPSIRNSETIKAFKQKLLPFIRLLENSIFNIFDPEGLELLTRLRLGFSHVNERLSSNFQEYLNPLCTCSLETEKISHYLLHCDHNIAFRTDLTNSVETFVVNFESLSDCKKVEILLYGESRCDDNQNDSLLSASINYITKFKSFDCSLFH